MKDMTLSDRFADVVGRIPVRLIQWCKRIWVTCAVFLVIFAIIVTIFRALTPWAAKYKDEFETRLTTILGAPVSIQTMKTSWYWFEPVLKLDGVLVADQGKSLLELKELLVGIDLMRSLLHWRIQPGVLFIEHGRLNLRQDHDTHWALEGSRPQATSKTNTSTDVESLVAWLLAHQKIVMKRVGVTLHWQDGRVTPIKPLTLIASNHDGHYRVKGHASLEGEAPSALSLLADLNMSSGFGSGVRGKVYVSAERVNFAEWRTFFDAAPYQIIDGKGELQVWLDVRNTRINAAHSAVRLRSLVWQEKGKKALHTLDRLSANMAWEHEPEGWTWRADHVRLKANQTTWPENAMRLEYNASEQRYRAFIKTILLEPARGLLQDVPEVLQPLMAMKPRGQLSNTQLGFQQHKLDYVLSRFSHLSWDAYEQIPAVSQLSGALAWEPREGRLALDGEHVTLAFKHKPPLQFDVINATLVWKALSQGWRVSLERGVLQHPHGVFSARGVLDDVSHDSSGTVQGNVSFSMHDATFWMPYLPEKGIKPKLNAWLQHDITRIDQASGRVHLQGPLHAFPFDHEAGEFLVTGSFDGVDLRFNPKWPLTKNISATVHVDKRTLAAEISHANFQMIPMEHASLRISDLGLHREVLSVRGDVHAPAEDMLAYIKTSPLHERLAKLDPLNIKRPAVLNLALDFPFYPEINKLKLQGRIDFQDNDLFLKDVSQTQGLHHLAGTLPFSEQGILESHLTAELFDEPMRLALQTHHGDEPHLAVDTEGHLSVDGMRKSLPMPALDLMQGRVAVKSHLVITDAPDDLDRIHINTSLEGLAIDLPPPFAKQRDEVSPLSVAAYFNLNRGIRLVMDYNKQLRTDVWFDAEKQSLHLARGEVVIGGKKAVLNPEPGVVLRGDLKRFDGNAWRRALSVLPETSDATPADVMPGFRQILLNIQSVDVLEQHYHHMHVDARRMSGAALWSAHIKTDAVSADLQYHPVQEKLTGYVSRWMIKKPASSMPALSVGETDTHWNPGKLPNLDVTLGSLYVGDVDAGKLSLKGTRLSHKAWRIDSGKLHQKNYDLDFSGGWKAAPKPQTLLDARLNIRNLDHALEHWGISPVVEAKHGDIQLSGRWNGAPQDFSLKAITGNMHIAFKDGRITHLSPETEKKMGLGKLLSILSLQTIPRRLKLDFSDLSKPGYSFDKFEGNFVLAHGIMETEDSAIDGPVARATMKGSLNLDKQLYDISLHISPHIAASLPVVATIAGGPVAGIATWVASKLINQGMERISGYTYDVSGPWLEPVVQQVHIYKKPAPPREDVSSLKIKGTEGE